MTEDIFDHLLKNKISHELSQDEIDNHPDSISEYEEKKRLLVSQNDYNDNDDKESKRTLLDSNSNDNNNDHEFEIDLNLSKTFLRIHDYYISFDNYNVKLERPYLLAKKIEEHKIISKTFCYRIISSCLSLHKIIDLIKPYFGLSEYGMLITKIEHKKKLLRLGVLNLSKSESDAPARLHSSMYVDMLSLPIEIIIDQYGMEILNCIRTVFAFREIIGFKTPNSGESLTKSSIFFDYKTADHDIESNIKSHPSKYILTFPETLMFNSKNSKRDELYTRRVLSKKYIKKFFETEEKYDLFLKTYIKLLDLKLIESLMLKTISNIDKSYEWLISYVKKRINTIK
jgi:hypothetical protein